jgi:anaerobic selenocysteine-containing dehydrogenase
MNDTARRFADVVLPSTCWLEELGCKVTNTHLYLMERALPAPGETRPLHWILNQLAGRLGLEDFYPWDSEEAVIDAILDHPYTGHATVESLRARSGMLDLGVSHVAYPSHEFTTPSGKVEFFSARAEELGLPALPPHEPAHEPSHQVASNSDYPLALCHGRTLSHFHAFYDHGRALPTLARQDPEPRLWISPADAKARKLTDGANIRIHNERGEFAAKAQVTDNISEGVVWIRDGWEGLNSLTEGRPVLPDAAVNLFHFSAGQATFDTRVEVSAAK